MKKEGKKESREERRNFVRKNGNKKVKKIMKCVNFHSPMELNRNYY
jgi:hypothetical protein